MSTSETARENDAREIAALLTESLPHHPISERRLRQYLFDHPGFDPALARVTRGDGGRIDSAAAAVLLHGKDGRRQAQLMVLATRSELRRRGLAGTLYAEIETVLRRRGIQDVLVASGVVPTGLDLRYTAATVLLLRRLYCPAVVCYDMTLDPFMPQLSIRPGPAGFEIRELTAADIPALDAFCRREFPKFPRGADFIGAGPDLGAIGAVDPASGEIVAYACFAEYVFGPTGTAVAHRRKGLGSAVFRPAIAAMLRGRPAAPILIGHANFPFYARAFGCHIRGVVWHMVKKLDGDLAISKGKELHDRV